MHTHILSAAPSGTARGGAGTAHLRGDSRGPTTLRRVNAHSTDQPDRRLLLVHAHPDDETIGTGCTMARYVEEGAGITLVTCTLGEEGEIVVPDLAHLGVDGDDALGEHRIGELTAAMDALGVHDHLRLGGDHRYRDSGMAYDDRGLAIARDVVADKSFWRADLLEAANELVPVIRDRRPQVVITYDENGGYGHPDHVMAHRVATYAVTLAGVPSYRLDLGEPWTVQRVLWSAIPAGPMREMIKRLRAEGDLDSFGGYDPDGEAPPPMATPDEFIDAVVDGGAWFERKLAAMRAHRSQIAEDSFFFRGGGPGESAGRMSSEAFRLASGQPFPPGGPADDVFAGLA